MSAGIDDAAAMKILRKEEELAIHAVARTQNGNVIPDVMFDWEVGADMDTVDDNPSDDTMSNMVAAEEVGTTTITVTAIDHNVAAEIDIEVTAKAGAITLWVGDDAFEADDSYFPGDDVGTLTAAVDVKHRAGSNVSWSSSNAAIAEVEVVEDVANNTMATVTAVAPGTAKITAAYEGKDVSFNVVVSGPSNDRVITYVLSEDTFTFKLASVNPVIALVDWAPATIQLEAILEDADGDPLSGKTVSAELSVTEASTTPVITAEAGTTNLAKTGNVASGDTAADGTIVFEIAAPDDNGATAGDTNYTVTLKSAGAPDKKVRIIASVVQQ